MSLLQQLQIVPVQKLKLGDILKEIISQNPSWIHNSIPFTIDYFLDEPEDADVCITISVDTPITSIGNTGRVGSEDIQKQTYIRPFIPRKEYLKQRGN